MYSGSSIKRNLKTKSKLSNTIERTSVSQIILQSINQKTLHSQIGFVATTRIQIKMGSTRLWFNGSMGFFGL